MERVIKCQYEMATFVIHYSQPNTVSKQSNSPSSQKEMDFSANDYNYTQFEHDMK